MLLWLLSVNFVSKFILIVVYCADLCNLFKKRIMALVAHINIGTEICSVRLRPEKAGAILVTNFYMKIKKIVYRKYSTITCRLLKLKL